jgi:hypothetical protein
MKTLFERLKPELLDAMHTESKLYPTLMESLREELKSKYSYLQLTVNQGQRLTQLKNQNIGILELVDCFED